MRLPSREEIRLTNYYVSGEIRTQGNQCSFALYAPKKKKRFCYCFDSVADDVKRLKLRTGSCVTVQGELSELVTYKPEDRNHEHPLYYERLKIKDIFISGPAYETEKKDESGGSDAGAATVNETDEMDNINFD